MDRRPVDDGIPESTNGTKRESMFKRFSGEMSESVLSNFSAPAAALQICSATSVLHELLPSGDRPVVRKWPPAASGARNDYYAVNG